MGINIKFTKMGGGKDVRTDETIGNTNKLPVAGESFAFVARPLTKLEPGQFGFRDVKTSMVVKVEMDGEDYILHTLNSVYRVTVLPGETLSDVL